MTALGPVRSDDFESILKEAVQECYLSGVRLTVISQYFGISAARVSQLASTPILKKLRKQEIERREHAIIRRRLGELKLRMDRGQK